MSSALTISGLTWPKPNENNAIKPKTPVNQKDNFPDGQSTRLTQSRADTQKEVVGTEHVLSTGKERSSNDEQRHLGKGVISETQQQLDMIGKTRTLLDFLTLTLWFNIVLVWIT